MRKNISIDYINASEKPKQMDEWQTATDCSNLMIGLLCNHLSVSDLRTRS